MFYIIDLPVIERARLQDFIIGQAIRSSNVSEVSNEWVQTGKYRPLTSELTTVIRTVMEQMPGTDNKIAILCFVYHHFKDSPHKFEKFRRASSKCMTDAARKTFYGFLKESFASY